MISLLFFLLMSFVGVILFGGLIKFYYFYYAYLAKKGVGLNEKAEVNEARRLAKLEFEQLISDLKTEDAILDARIQQKKEHLIELNRNVSSLKDQAIRVDLIEDIKTLKHSLEVKNKELHKKNKTIQDVESSYRNLNEFYKDEKAVRIVSLKQEINDIREQRVEKVSQDIDDYSNLRLKDTNIAVDKATMSAINSLIDWWNAEEKKFAANLSADYGKVYKQTLDQIEGKVAEMIYDTATEINVMSES